ALEPLTACSQKNADGRPVKHDDDGDRQ
ncbi:hypothetical protein A2U01_0066906, partial [Trifolium medium]|nr:hypothetical protein [Trifolium medium]